MVEQIRISPEEVRGYGNVCEEHSLDDFIVSSSGLAKEKETVHGALTNVYKLVYSLYGLMFDFDKGNKQLYLQMGEADILSFGFDDDSKQLYLLDMARTGLSLGFDEDTNELYINDAPPIVHNYSLAFSAASYVATGGSATLECTLLDNNVPVEGATISVSGSDSSLYTGITNTDGIAQVTVTNISAETTFTATYSSVSDTCTVTTPSVIYQPALEGTESKYTISGSTTIANGVMSCGASYLTPGWDNTGNWKLTFEAKITNDGSAVSIYNPSDTQRDKNQIKITGNYHKNIASYTNGNTESSKTTSVPVATWFAIECVKNGNSLTATWNNNSYTVTWTQLTTLSTVCIGVDSWGQCASIRNIKVESL